MDEAGRETGQRNKKRGGWRRRSENSHPQQMCCKAFVSGWQVHYHRLMRSLVLPVAAIRGSAASTAASINQIRRELPLKHQILTHTDTRSQIHRCLKYTNTSGTYTNTLKHSIQSYLITAGGKQWWRMQSDAEDCSVIMRYLWTQWTIISTSSTTVRCDHEDVLATGATTVCSFFVDDRFNIQILQLHFLAQSNFDYELERLH